MAQSSPGYNTTALISPSHDSPCDQEGQHTLCTSQSKQVRGPTLSPTILQYHQLLQHNYPKYLLYTVFEIRTSVDILINATTIQLIHLPRKILLKDVDTQISNV